MLKRLENQENILLIFFVVVLLIISCFVIFNKDFVDVIYYGVVFYYFVRFMILRFRR